MANMKKTKCMATKPKCDKVLYVRTFYLNGKVNKTTSKESYLGVDITDDTTVWHTVKVVIVLHYGIIIYTDTVLTQLHVAHNNIFRLLFRFPTRGTIYNFLVRNTCTCIPNLFY